MYTLTNYKIGGSNFVWMSDKMDFLLSGKAMGKIKNKKTPIIVGTVEIYVAYKNKK